jgi:hypothetical protein
MVVVSLFPLRDYSRRPCWIGYGCHGACRLERDTCSDFPYQDERREGLKIAKTIESRLYSHHTEVTVHTPHARRPPKPVSWAGSSVLYMAMIDIRKCRRRVKRIRQVSHVQDTRNGHKTQSRSSPEDRRCRQRRQTNNKLQLFSGFSWLVATCICSESASNVLELSKCFICSQLDLLKASHAGAMLI